MGDLQPTTDAVNRVLRERAPLSAIPYERLTRAETVARERFPNAADVKALWTPASSAGEIVVEVWDSHDRRVARADVWVPSAADLLPAS